MKRKNIHVSLALFIVLLLVSSLLGACSQGGTDAADKGPKVIRLSIGGGHPKAGMSYVTAADDFFLPEISKRVKENTDYEIKWTTAYAGSVAQLAEVFEAVESGTLDFGLLGFAFEPTSLFIFNVGFYVPFGNPDPLEANRIAWKLFNEFPAFEEVMNKGNQKLLCIAPTGNYTLNTTFPVYTFKDFEGRKLAAAGPNLPWLKDTGIVPIQSSFNDCYTSYTTGVYDGFISYLAPVYGYKLYEAAPYQINLNYGAVSINGISVNNDTWNSLPEEVKEIILEVSEEYIDVSAQVTIDMEKDALDAMIPEGFEVMEIPHEEMVKYVNSLPEIPNANAQEMNKLGYPGTDIIKRYIELIEESGRSLPRKWKVD